MKIVRKESGNVLLTDNNGNTIKRLPEYAVLELKSDREGEFIRVAYGHQNKHDIYPKQITATQVEPNSEIPFNGTAQDLLNLASTDFFFNVTQGFIDYNDTSSAGGIFLPANTWVDIPNDGLGAFSNFNYLPQGVTQLIDTSTGYLDCSQLKNGVEFSKPPANLYDFFFFIGFKSLPSPFLCGCFCGENQIIYQDIKFRFQVSFVVI